MSRSNLCAHAAGLLMAWGCASAAVAQTAPKPAPAKPAATSGADGKTLDGKAASTGKVMSINELKACLARQDELKVTGTDLERQKQEVDQQRTVVQTETDALTAERQKLTGQNDATNKYNERVKALSDRISAWNTRSTELASSERTGPSADRARRELAAEQKELEAADVALKAEAAALTAGLQDAAKVLNARAEAQGKMANEWNARNAKLNADVTAYENARVDWREECGSRRYREDDEKALRSGK